MTELTTTSSFEVEEYLQAVRVALADLPAETREDLLNELPDHLAEVLAEGGSLRDRLGDPKDYAVELRAAAGLEAGSGDRRAPDVAALMRRVGERLQRADVAVGRVVGYGRASQLWHAVQPGWWVLRGWFVAQLVCYAADSSAWKGVVPRYSGSRAVGTLVLVVAVLGSVAIGRRGTRAGVWPRTVLAFVSVALLVWGLGVLPTKLTRGSDGGFTGMQPSPADDIGDIYVYDSNGKLVQNARLYDQYGNPIQLGSPYCEGGALSSALPTDGYYDPDAGAYYGPDPAPAWTYPLCPNSGGPFRSGPGALPRSNATPTATPTATPSHAATPTR
jgi:hypothetical protein